jgi:hypothetical protein
VRLLTVITSTTIKHTALPAILQVMLMAEVTAANSTHKTYKYTVTAYL